MTGHSLGGSLALLLALDIAVNHIEQIEDFHFENENENEEENEIEKDVRKKTSYTAISKARSKARDPPRL